MAVLVDDALLLRVLAGDPPAEAGGEDISTTGLWYFRLGQALRAGPPTGALSRRLGGLPPDRRERVVRLVDELPRSIGLLSLRTLVPVIRRLDPGARLNLLSAEALATAYVLGAAVLVATDGPLLRAACRDAGLSYVVVTN